MAARDFKIKTSNAALFTSPGTRPWRICFYGNLRLNLSLYGEAICLEII